MTEDNELDRRLVGWISSGPNAAPPEVIERALIETTTVVRLPKREPSHIVRSLLVGTLLALIVLIVAVGAAVLLLGR
jgi:hypothetical protein